MVDRASELDTDTPTDRATQIDDEIWLARLLLVDATAADETTLQRLVDLIAEHPDQTAARGGIICQINHRRTAPVRLQGGVSDFGRQGFGGGSGVSDRR
jgi:hypothetical protein